MSLVIPAWNEQALLPALFDSIDAAKARYAGSVQVIVANNASTDDTAAIAKARGAQVADVPTRGIAHARNGGAAMASGDVLCFVDADSVIHPLTFHAIDAALSDARTGGGATGATVERWTPPLRMLFAMSLPFRAMGMDTGVVFCRREAFEAVGGYDTKLPVAEDVDFLLRLRAQLKRKGQRMKRLTGVEAVTSSRKFDKYGHWGFTARMLRLPLLRVVARERFEKEVSRLWYEDR